MCYSYQYYIDTTNYFSSPRLENVHTVCNIPNKRCAVDAGVITANNEEFPWSLAGVCSQTRLFILWKYIVPVNFCVL